MTVFWKVVASGAAALGCAFALRLMPDAGPEARAAAPGSRGFAGCTYESYEGTCRVTGVEVGEPDAEGNSAVRIDYRGAAFRFRRDVTLPHDEAERLRGALRTEPRRLCEGRVLANGGPQCVDKGQLALDL